MSEQGSKPRIRFVGKILIVTVACVLLGLTKVDAQQTGIRIIKEVNVVGGVSSIAFSFTSTGGAPLPSNFALIDDDNTAHDRITQLYDTVPDPFTVTEQPVPNWQIDHIVCSINEGGGFVIISPPKVEFHLLQGGFAECKFVNVALAVTAATGSISGRVTTSAGMGIRGALVTMHDASTNTTKVAVTNSFGYYRFAELPVENFYILNVSSKRYTFSSPQQTVQLHGDLADVNFTSDP